MVDVFARAQLKLLSDLDEANDIVSVVVVMADMCTAVQQGKLTKTGWMDLRPQAVKKLIVLYEQEITPSQLEVWYDNLKQEKRT